MDQITIQNIDDSVIARLRQLAWQEGVSLEESLKRRLIETVQPSRFFGFEGYYPVPTD